MLVIMLSLMIAIALLVFAALVRRQKSLVSSEAARPSASSEPSDPGRQYWTTNVELADAGDIPVVHSYIPWGSARRPGEVREIRYIVIHETDNRRDSADAEAHNTYLTENGTDITAWHYTVDDHSIYHNIPDNEIAWNAGDNRTKDGGNMNGIGIELCVNIGNDYDATLANGAMLAASLMKAYDLTPDDLRLHEDFMDKICPHRMITEGRVSVFQQMVKDDYAQLMQEAEPTAVPQASAEAEE